MPDLNNIDHVHVNVRDRREAEDWYARVLGFQRVPELAMWAADGGPLVVQNPAGSVHLALFEADGPVTAAAAFGTDGEGFLAWKAHLEREDVALRVADHELAWSLYFSDPYGNSHEITTYDHAAVARALAAP